jgi:hypothetical protein
LVTLGVWDVVVDVLLVPDADVVDNVVDEVDEGFVLVLVVDGGVVLAVVCGPTLWCGVALDPDLTELPSAPASPTQTQALSNPAQSASLPSLFSNGMDDSSD